MDEKNKIDHSELGDFTFNDIEEIFISVKIKGKSYAILPKKGCEAEAEINRKTTLYLMFDEHIIAVPSIDETVAFKKIIMTPPAHLRPDMHFIEEIED